MKRLVFISLLIIVSWSNVSNAQTIDKCGWDLAPDHMLKAQAPGWGYPYDSLLVDLQRWAENPYVRIDSAGASVQDRTLWLLTIQDTASGYSPTWRISIHARTHPNEVQSSWVTNEMIDLLLSEELVAQTLRRNCIFNIIPMYNPDGVELGLPRVNANGVDLERNWDDVVQEPEAAVLKGLFESYMNSDVPIRIALNMHSAFSCKRYFVYHHENGTSIPFTIDEKKFIGSVRQNWPEGIEDWNYFVSWTDGTPPYYPESWFWFRYAEQVMALTYEDMNCAANGDYDLMADAMLKGIETYLQYVSSSTQPQIITRNNRSEWNIYPNPVQSNSRLSIASNDGILDRVSFSLYNILGQKVHAMTGSNLSKISIQLPNLAPGIYYLRVDSEKIPETVPVFIIR